MDEHVPCEDLECQICCDHEYDINEGYICSNCGKQGDMGELIDRLEWTYE